MKVCTDACVFGAWAEVAGANRILDIGTGTGLLSLMAAQRNPEARIDGVEIDADACEQTRQNFEASPFHERLKVYHSSIQDFTPDFSYDAIICNPPFFQNDLKSPDPKVNKAHHAATLNLQELFASVDRLLSAEGQFHLLLPPYESRVSELIGKEFGLRVIRELNLIHQPGHKTFRRMTSWKRFIQDEEIVGETEREDLYIYQNTLKEYNTRFKEYLKAFYLAF